MKFLSHVKKYPTLFSVIIFFILVAGAFVVDTKPGNAITGFGGKIIDVIPCTCGANIGLAIIVESFPTLTDPTPFPKAYILNYATSISFRNYQFERPGPWIIGTQIPIPSPAGVCLIGAAGSEWGCTDITEGLLLMTGGTRGVSTGLGIMGGGESGAQEPITGGFIGNIITNGTSM